MLLSTALLGGTFWYFGSIGALFVACPVLAVAMAAVGGVTVKIIWDNKDVVLLVKRVGEKFKPKHESLYGAAAKRAIGEMLL